MNEGRRVAERLRLAATVGPETPVDVEWALPRLYEATCVRLPGLSVMALREWLDRHGVIIPGLVGCRDRRLRGGIVAQCGRGVLFADRDDTPEEIRFTFAHEGWHYLGDHLYPRQDLEMRLGPRIREVLDGRRTPTREERIDALLARKNLTLHTHLLARDGSQDGELWTIEAKADAFAWEVLAPSARVNQWLSSEGRLSGSDLMTRLEAQFHLPRAQAQGYACFLQPPPRPRSLIERMQLI